jgi:HPt (histidine-containing phosphotransfer) domain-containing protein
MTPLDDQLLNKRVVLSACGGDEESLRGLCEAFLRVLPSRMSELRDALERRDADRLRDSAHRACALLYAFSSEAGDSASELEDRAALGKFDLARPILDRLEAMASRLSSIVGNLTMDALQARTRGGE